MSFFPVFSQTKEEILTDKKKEKLLKKIYWSKIKSSISKNYSVDFSKLVDYNGCGENFPSLPGKYPCSLLSDEYSKGGLEENLSDLFSRGKIEIKVSSDTNSFGGKVYIISDNSNKDNKYLLKAFFGKDRFLSFYIYKKNIVYFKWSGKGETKSISSIYVVDLNEKKEPENIRRILF
ncbi:MAG: hypothetical protein KDK36_16370 [Leptospiraceae bacterium]|nr:hypothetical protein [Leptospiraceae bacterium]